MTPLINNLVFGKRAEEIRAMGWKPYLVVFDDHGQECELISYPYQDGGIAMIQVRTVVGDPTTMVKKHCSSLFPVLTHELTKRRKEIRQQNNQDAVRIVEGMERTLLPTPEEQRKRDEFDQNVDEGHDGILA